MSTTNSVTAQVTGWLIAACGLGIGGASASEFASERPAARVEYWQERQKALEAEVADADRMQAVRLVFVGDSITDFWLLGDDPWIPGRTHGRAIWNDSFAGAEPANRSLNIGISGDRTEHLLYRILPKVEGGLGELDSGALNPEFFILMVGINNSYAAESPAEDSVYSGIVAVMRSLHARKPTARLILQSMLPTSEPTRDESVVRPVNARLAALASSPEFSSFTIWLDLYPSFLDAHGRQSAALFVDGLHPSEEGYRVWRNRLVSALAAARSTAP